MKFLVFADTKIDSLVQMQLIDLARALSKDDKMEVEFSFHSYLERHLSAVHVSQFWNPYPKEMQLQGWKSDVYLRAYGAFYYTDDQVIWQTLQGLSQHPQKEFLKQILMFSEDFRLEKWCVADRQGMQEAFAVRKEAYLVHYSRQYRQHMQAKRWIDALFCHIVLLANRRFAAVPDTLQELYKQLRRPLGELGKAESTAEIAEIILNIADILSQSNLPNTDMSTAYFSFADRAEGEDGETFNDLTRENEKKSGASNRIDDDQNEQDEGKKEAYSSWHDETSDPQDSFLQMDLDQGTSTDLLGEGARKAESGDQVFGSVQASAQSAQGNDFSETADAQAETDGTIPGSGDAPNPYGHVNRHVTEHHKQAEPSDTDELLQYDAIKAEVTPFVSKLKQSFLKTMEHKKNQPAGDLHFGRLGKKLIRLVTDDNPRLFYKKQESQQELDTTFTLLVDCSASMFNKMEETHKGIVLFHETLKSLKIPHSVVGFWEDAADASATEQPNYFQEVISYRSSLYQNGSSILQLEPQEDNRDGYAIRRMGEELLKRTEKQKFLLVFSDGEPAAFDYETHGIMDSHEAVLKTRKQGIETLGMFIANGEVTEKEEQLMQNIYGAQSVVVPDASQLTEYLMPVLRKLLFKLL
ncbi:vWA domain-containing protein [Fictibacillus iocasae]|uniref:VWA domain-containing protein n=1 Tax=Fictibacillus iocasae TaxID=2715437 RepID=A0ABW2NPW6_9BACL